MKKETILIAPKLKEEQQQEFLNFCTLIKKTIDGKAEEQRIAELIRIKEEVNLVYTGKKFHANTDLAFVENLVLDLMLQDWELVLDGNKIQLEQELPEEKKDLNVEKKKTRRRHLLARDVQLKVASVVDFIRGMEKKRLTVSGWHSIFSLMRDGAKLASELQSIQQHITTESKVNALNLVIKPYIQFVESGKRCVHTGLYLSDIWRYFRHTWINEYQSLPGRSISILVRDAAAPNHPVIGIAGLGSSVAQQTCRDKWIGWEGKTFLERLQKDPSAKYSKWILKTLDMLLEEVYLADFIKDKILTRKAMRNPSLEKIKELREWAVIYRMKHTNNPHNSKFSAVNDAMSWKQRAETHLFKSKRAMLLGELLSIKKVFQDSGFSCGSREELTHCLLLPDFREAIQRLIRKAKSIHVGINMMDIIVCGSVAPYNHLLGGKLVCMLLTSPQVIQYYNKKYNDSVSLIASSMRGKAVMRKPQLLLLGTTSLYGVGSSQYNRIKIPTEIVGGKRGQTIEYRELGYSEGYGSFHFSSTTKKLADAVAGRENGRTRVNSIFGEGANPLMRKLKDAMEALKLDSNPILNHRNRRVVYGIALAENFGDVLLGMTSKPKYFIPQQRPLEKTERIGKFWIQRWLLNRINNIEVMGKVARHSLAYPVTHGARVPIIENQQEPNLFNGIGSY